MSPPLKRLLIVGLIYGIAAAFLVSGVISDLVPDVAYLFVAILLASSFFYYLRNLVERRKNTRALVNLYLLQVLTFFLFQMATFIAFSQHLTYADPDFVPPSGETIWLSAIQYWEFAKLTLDQSIKGIVFDFMEVFGWTIGDITFEDAPWHVKLEITLYRLTMGSFGFFAFIAVSARISVISGFLRALSGTSNVVS